MREERTLTDVTPRAHRQLFLHHYLPAHICACLAAGGVLQFIVVEEVAGPLSAPGPLLASSSPGQQDHITPSNPDESPRSSTGVSLSLPTSRTDVHLPKGAVVAIGCLMALTAAMFWFLSPFTYGTPGLTNQQWLKMRLLSSWSLHFLPSMQEMAQGK